jgi:hypothetical protein
MMKISNQADVDTAAKGGCMRILMLAQFYHPIFGSIEQHVRTLNHELVARGHAVSVATMRHKD